MLKRVAFALGLVLLAGCFVLGQIAERFANRVEPVALPALSAQARALHAEATVVDLHADSLLFGRDLARRSGVGHVDLPRLREGGVALQVFDAVTVAPLGQNIESTDGAAPNLLDLLDLARLRLDRVGRPLARALGQAAALEALAAAPASGLRLVRSRAELAELRAARASDPDQLGALLGIEGAHALEGDLASLDALYAAGYRVIGLAHFFDNEFAGSAHGVEKPGLSELGRALVTELAARHMLLDLAHASPRAFDEALALSTRPVLVSHTGVRGTCDNARNLSDAQLRAVAATGGVVGIGFWQTAVCSTSPRAIAAAIAHAVRVAGPDHVALGSDYDGATTVGFDVSQLAAVTQALVDAGLPDAAIRAVLGGNALRVFESALPD